MRAPGKALRTSIAALLACVCAWAADPPDRALFDHINALASELTGISGLKLKHPVPSDFITRDKVKAFLEDRVKEVAKPEEIRAEELTLKKFGLVPPDFDLAKTTVDLLTEQAAAFYDFNKKRLFITDWTSSDTREPALVHELAHALADQSFNLKKFIQQGQKSDDGAMARMAVMEGQASWLMAEYMARRMGQSLATSPSLLHMMSRAMESGADFPVFEKAPLYMRRTLLFPYADGMLFQNGVFARLGKQGFAEVFRRPPVSTQQILHIERYFDGAQPEHPALPELPSSKGFKGLVEGSIGELDHSILLEQYTGKEESAAVAPHWKGGQYRLWEHRSPERVVLAYASEWDDAAMARRYFNLYRQVLRKKWKSMQVESEDGDCVAGRGDDGYFQVRLDGARVTSLEGLESPLPPAR